MKVVTASFTVSLSSYHRYEPRCSHIRAWPSAKTSSLNRPFYQQFSSVNQPLPDRHTYLSRPFLFKSWLYSETDRRNMGITPANLFAQAKKRINENDLKGGITLINKMRSLVIPRHDELSLYEQAGEYLIDHHHLQDGIALWEIAYKMGHKSQLMQLILGQYYLKLGKLTEAELQFKKFTEDYPDNPRGHHELGIVYLMRALMNVKNDELFNKNKSLCSEKMVVALEKAALFDDKTIHSRSPYKELCENMRVVNVLDNKSSYGDQPSKYLEFECGISILRNAMIKSLTQSNQIEIQFKKHKRKKSSFGVGIGYSPNSGFKPVISYSPSKSGFGIGWSSDGLMPAKSLYQFNGDGGSSSYHMLATAARNKIEYLYSLEDRTEDNNPTLTENITEHSNCKFKNAS